MRTAASVSVVPACRPLSVEYAAAPLAFASPDVGVGQVLRIASMESPGSPLLPMVLLGPPCFPSLAIGVGHIRRASVSSDSLTGPFGFCPPWLFPYGVAVGVGQNEEPLPDVRRPHVARAKARPLRIEPERGQVPEYPVEPSSSESADVFHDDEAGS